MQIEHLARDDVSHGLSGAEVVAACRNAALLALEEHDTTMSEGSEEEEKGPTIRMKHLLNSLEGMERQITTDMLDFYDKYRRSVSR